ncbi:hypothetical protein AVEN_67085-1 [Araneus ventricosus]|uniref:Uncharacterized protein n=1 Tax=Araneus ventricosus TaxID=182803 RepID=A0A4Y2FSM0_ARAVE|nr:hypothetical protein AVEN_67085-1 [Araneus ventricosus]
MLAGHTYSRAVRGHTLLLIAISEIIFSEMNLSSEEQFMDAYPNNLHEATPSFSTVEELRILYDAEKKCQNKCFQLKERSNIEIMGSVFGHDVNHQRVY